MPFPRFLRNWITPFVNPRQLGSTVFLPKFFAEFLRYRSQSCGENISLRDSFPCLSDHTSHTPFDPHYFFQGAWLARCLAAMRPPIHVDVGSSVVMNSVLSGAVPIVSVDYRPLYAKLRNLYPVAGNVIRLPFSNESLMSISSLHVIEHIGLGRYGDPIDPYGSRWAMGELQRVLKPGGTLYLSVPVGRERVCFNAHRVFAPETVIRFAPKLSLRTFSLVDDHGRFEEDTSVGKAANFEYGCGMFEFVRPHV